MNFYHKNSLMPQSFTFGCLACLFKKCFKCCIQKLKGTDWADYRIFTILLPQTGQLFSDLSLINLFLTDGAHTAAFFYMEGVLRGVTPWRAPPADSGWHRCVGTGTPASGSGWPNAGRCKEEEEDEESTFVKRLESTLNPPLLWTGETFDRAKTLKPPI